LNNFGLVQVDQFVRGIRTNENFREFFKRLIGYGTRGGAPDVYFVLRALIDSTAATPAP
jgi:hypothetical protein